MKKSFRNNKDTYKFIEKFVLVLHLKNLSRKVDIQETSIDKYFNYQNRFLIQFLQHKKWCFFVSMMHLTSLGDKKKHN
jgi:hypothetical protein